MADLADGETFKMQGSGSKPYVLKNVGGWTSDSAPFTLYIIAVVLSALSGFGSVLVATLPPLYRAAVLLRHLDGMSYGEMAAVLDRPGQSGTSHRQSRHPH